MIKMVFREVKRGHLAVVGVDTVHLIFHICELSVDGCTEARAALHEVLDLAQVFQELALRQPLQSSELSWLASSSASRWECSWDEDSVSAKSNGAEVYDCRSYLSIFNAVRRASEVLHRGGTRSSSN